jgi:hypothetical protein
MVNNSTNINKTNYHLSPETIEQEKEPRHMALEIHILAWNRHKHVVGLNRLMGSQRSPLKKI